MAGDLAGGVADASEGSGVHGIPIPRDFLAKPAFCMLA
jgi:hypothetical protein